MRFPFLPLTGLLALVGVASLGLMARDEKVRALRLPKQSAVYLSIQVSKVWESEPGKQVLSLLDKDIQRRMFDEDRLGLKPEQIERAEMIALSLQKFEEQGAVILTLQKAIDEKVLRRIIGGDPKTKTIHGQKVYGEGVRAGFLRADGKMLVIGTVTMVEKLLDPETATPTGNLALAVEKGQANHLAGYLDPKELAGPARELPAAFAPVRPLLASKSGVVWANVGLSSTLETQIDFADEKAAERGRKSLNGLRALGAVTLSTLGDTYAAQSKLLGAFLGKLGKVLDDSEVEHKDTRIGMKMALKVEKAELTALIKDALVPLREAAMRQQMANNLKQLGLAMHNHHDSTGMLPSMSTYDKDGKPLLSWRVHVLPFIDQEALYKQFKLDEPWDSAHNKKLIAKMPPLYATPGKASAIEGGTRIQAFVGKGAFFEGKRGLRFADFTDGLSNTFMLVEAEKEVPWTKPEDLTFDPEAKMLPKLGGAFKGGFHALFGDGSVRFIVDTLKPQTLKLYIQRNDGMAIPKD